MRELGFHTTWLFELSQEANFKFSSHALRWGTIGKGGSPQSRIHQSPPRALLVGGARGPQRAKKGHFRGAIDRPAQHLQIPDQASRLCLELIYNILGARLGGATKTGRNHVFSCNSAPERQPDEGRTFPHLWRPGLSEKGAFFALALLRRQASPVHSLWPFGGLVDPSGALPLKTPPHSGGARPDEQQILFWASSAKGLMSYKLK